MYDSHGFLQLILSTNLKYFFFIVPIIEKFDINIIKVDYYIVI